MTAFERMGFSATRPRAFETNKGTDRAATPAPLKPFAQIAHRTRPESDGWSFPPFSEKGVPWMRRFLAPSVRLSFSL